MNYRYWNKSLQTARSLILSAFFVTAAAFAQQPGGEAEGGSPSVSTAPAAEAYSEALSLMAGSIPTSSLAIFLPGGSLDEDASRELRRMSPVLAFAASPTGHSDHPSLLAVNLEDGIISGARMANSPRQEVAKIASILSLRFDGVQQSASGDRIEFYEVRVGSRDSNRERYSTPILYVLTDEKNGMILFSTHSVDWARMGGRLLGHDILQVRRSFDTLSDADFFDVLREQVNQSADTISFSGSANAFASWLLTREPSVKSLRDNTYIIGSIATSDVQTDIECKLQLPEHLLWLAAVIGEKGKHALLADMPRSEAIIALRLSSWNALLNFWLDWISKSQYGENQEDFELAKEELAERTGQELDYLLPAAIQNEIVWTAGRSTRQSILKIAIEEPDQFNEQLTRMIESLGGSRQRNEAQDFAFEQAKWPQDQIPPLFWMMEDDSITVALSEITMTAYNSAPYENWSSRFPDAPEWFNEDGDPFKLYFSKYMVRRFVRYFSREAGDNLFSFYASASVENDDMLLFRARIPVDFNTAVKRFSEPAYDEIFNRGPFRRPRDDRD